jgi:hypothetical protein
MKMKVFGLAAIGLACFAGVAVAQTTPNSNPQTLTPEETQGVLEALAKQRTGAAASTAPLTGSKADVHSPTPALVLGWNYAHATYCGWYVDSNGGQWFYIYPAEGGIVYAINNLYISQGLQISCGNANWFAWHVVNTTTGAYDQTWSYSYK